MSDILYFVFCGADLGLMVSSDLSVAKAKINTFYITKTRLLNYFTTKKAEKFQIKILIFFISLHKT